MIGLRRLLRWGRSLLVGALIAALLLMPVYAAQDEPRKTIRVGFFAFDGYHTIDENGVRGGYGYEFLRMAARYLNVDFEYVGYECSWDDMLNMLRDGQIDLLTSARVTPERTDGFAFSKPIGTSSAMLTVREGNTSIVSGRYDTYDGMRIGLLESSSRNQDLENFAQENGFSYTPVYFRLHTELEQALQSGQIDAALTSSLRQPEDEWILDYFAVEQFYALVRREDTALLEQINYAIEQLNAVEGDWKNDLNNKHYFHWEERDLTFTPEEQELIRQYAEGEKQLVVSVCTDKKPYAYTENGEARGILLDYFAALADYVGVPYTVVAPSDRAQYNRWCEEENVANVFLDGRFSNDQQAEDMGKAITSVYTTMRLAMVTRRDFDGQINTLAVSEGQGLFGIEDGLAPNAERLAVRSREEAMRAVLSGKADATFVYLYTAQQFVNQDERGLLTYTMLSEPTYDYHVVFASNVNHALAGIFTKAIYAMPTGTFENIASEYTSYRAKDIDITTWVRIHPIPTLAVGSVIVFMVALILLVLRRQKDVKRERERAEQMRELAALADSANQAKTMFLNSMSHDIRTPMNAILGFTALAESHLDDPRLVKEYLQKISVSGEHLLGLISDVLDMSRIESGRVKLDEQPLHLPELLRDICTIMQPTIESRQIHFSVEAIDVRDEDIVADKLRLNQILLNMLSNGVKFNKQGGMLSLCVRQLPKRADDRASYQFIVRDTGIGMKPEFANHIFDAFAREQTATVSGIQGTGLGMTITKNIVEMMGGDIRVHSKAGEGTEFTVTLTFKTGGKAAAYETPDAMQEQQVPAVDDDAGSAMNTAAMPAGEQTPAFAGRRVLLVEDNPLNQEIAATLLEEMGVTVETAEDGCVAVEMLQKAAPGQYDLVFMDIQMPIMDGYEATRRIRAMDGPAASVPVVAMTANAFSEDEQKAWASGMNGYLTKPINVEKLAEALRDAPMGKMSRPN